MLVHQRVAYIMLQMKSQIIKYDLTLTNMHSVKRTMSLEVISSVLMFSYGRSCESLHCH
jgi:hypothetical protein